MSALSITRFAAVRPTTGQTGARHPVGSVRLMLRAWQTRHALLALSAREREDIGITATAAVAEAARMPWDLSPRPRRSRPGLVAAVQRALERVRTRRLLVGLSLAELSDISASRSDAQREAAKFFWQA